MRNCYDETLSHLMDQFVELKAHLGDVEIYFI